MQVLTFFAQSKVIAGFKTSIIIVVGDPAFFPQTEDWLEKILFTQREIVSGDSPLNPSLIEARLKKGNVILRTTYRDEQPLEQYEAPLLKASDSPGVFVCLGERPRIPESLRPFTKVIWYLWPSLTRVINVVERKFGHLTPEQREFVEQQVAPMLMSVDYRGFSQAVENSAHFDDLIGEIRREDNLPFPILTIAEAWIDDRETKAVDLMMTSAELLRGLETKAGKGKLTIALGLKGPATKVREVSEGVCYLINDRQAGIMITLNLNQLDRESSLSEVKEIPYWQRKASTGFHYRTEGYAVVLVRGVEEFALAREIYQELAGQERTAAVFFEVLGDSSGWQIPVVDLENGNGQNLDEVEEVEREKIEIRREPNPVCEPHEKNFIQEETMLNGTIISAISDKMKNAERRQAWASLAFGTFLIIANFGFNVLGLLPAFLRPDPMVKLAEMMKTSNASTFVLLMINLFVGSGIAWAIRHMEVTGLAHWNEGNFPKSKAIFGYCCGTLLNLIGFWIVGPMPDDVLSKVGLGLFLLFVAFAVDFFGDIMFEEAFEILFKKTGQTPVITQTEEQTETEAEPPQAQVHADLFPVRGRKRCSFAGCENLVEEGTMAARMFSRDGKRLFAVGCPQKHLDALERMSARNMGRTTFSHVYESAAPATARN